MASSDDHHHDEDEEHCLQLMMSSKVCIIETVVVSARAANSLPVVQPPPVISLSNLDRQCPLLMYLVLFYNNPTTTSTTSSSAHLNWSLDSVFQSFKSGLEETLSIWYPAAGRLIDNSSDDDDDNSNKGTGLNLLCNNKGCILAKATTAVKISDLGDLSHYNHLFENLVYRPPSPQRHQHLSQMPLVAAQVTRLGCGGYSVGIGISHSLFDGPSAYEFMSAWASHSNSTTNLFKPPPNHDPDQNKPVVHDRDALLMTRVVDDDHDSCTCRAAAIDHLYQLFMQSAADPPRTTISMIKTSTTGQNNNNYYYVHKTFHLSTAFINSLKQQQQLVGDHDNLSCSSFELVAAHLWKAKTLALGARLMSSSSSRASSNKERMVCLQFAVDARNKVDPPLPQGFTGNAYVLASVALTASQLVDQSDLKSIVDKIREAKKSVTNKYVKSYMEALGSPTQQQSYCLPPLDELTMVSDWTRMPFHKLAFLQQEEAAAYASPLVAPVPEVIYFMQNPKDDKAIDMRIALLPQYLDAFTRYFLASITIN